ncbi:hypothetical protein BU26DRAFT_156336 [Trematosphaeria pertusa]|uniref:Uncharacterized protein n=1 Tax=Trematosphaeria pertusa TaxID=390896 RepID=A0A6A6IYP1_9PLEO|nr:uncharacterized protein BU26DRAFT_156336 [Trematosphaeria pertusa]KAF2255456.1 hypothetical protein BU26DRAFT_156336 [Trematosphaeria pertusa]
MAPKRPLRQRASTAPQQPSTPTTSSSKRRKTCTPISHQPASAFFALLPRELRDQIYHEIWAHKRPFYLIYKETEFVVEYSIRVGLRPPFPRLRCPNRPLLPSPWFFANKQMLAEAITQFDRQSTWTFKRDNFSNNAPKKTPSRLLLNPWKTHTLDLGKLKVSEQAELQSNERTVTTLVQFIEPVPQPLRYRRMGFISSPNLRILKLELSVSSYAPCKDPNRPIEVDLRALTSLTLQSLNVVEMKVSFGNYFEGDDALKARLKDSIEALGPVLLGGQGRQSLEVGKEALEVVWRYRFTKA